MNEFKFFSAFQTLFSFMELVGFASFWNEFLFDFIYCFFVKNSESERSLRRPCLVLFNGKEESSAIDIFSSPFVFTTFPEFR